MEKRHQKGAPSPTSRQKKLQSCKKVKMTNSNAPNPLIDESMVGREREQKKIIDQLTQGTPGLESIIIAGEAGIGKTVLAKCVYHNPSVVDHFDIRAWFWVSESHINTVLDILSGITHIPDTLVGWRDRDLEEMLRKILRGRRYLIVMDDMRYCEDLFDFRCFPDDGTGSRILVTSRESELTWRDNPNVDVHLGPLTQEESLQLLENNVFHSKGCSPELSDVAEMMVTKTEGLPLAIVMLAEILAGTEKEKGRWEQIAESLSFDPKAEFTHGPKERWENFARSLGQTECQCVFETIYQNLPENLKPCLLYLAAFPKDFEIPARKLIQLWIAEGFVTRFAKRNLEDTARDLLLDLTRTRLVIACEEGSLRGGKTYRLHHLIQKLCLAKAGEQNFFQQICENCGLSTSGRLDIPNHRLSICCKGKVEDFSTFSTNPSLGSLLCFQYGYWPSRRQLRGFSSYISGLKGLTVLELSEVFIDESFFTFQLPIHLTYLSVNGAIHDIPPSIAELSNLEILIVKGDEGTIQVPECIWNLTKLRHLRIDNRASFKFPGNISFKLENLEVLSYLVLSHEENANKILKALSRLRKLKCSVVQKKREVCSSDLDSYPRLDSLSRLESLHIRYCGFLGNSSSVFNLPLYLQKLTLSHLSWNNISTFARLPLLQVLKILSGSFENDWLMGREEFQFLRILKLCRLRIRKWDAKRTNFPRLEKLIVERCEKLESIPSSLGRIHSLELIDVMWCSPFLSTSVRQIHEERRNRHSEGLEVRIFP